MSRIKVAVVIPAYKEELNEFEKISLAQAGKVLGKYPLIFVAPEGKNLSYAEAGDLIVRFPPQFFQSVETYNRLMMSPQFYAPFLNLDYILIYQLDAFVFYDAPEFFCSLGYDYIGAPWPRMFIESRTKMVSRVGNGGFSLRNVKAHHELLNEHSDLAKNLMGLPEDVFFSHCGRRDDCDFRVAPINVAYKFSAEFNPARVVKKNRGKLPFGCHAWQKFSADFYVKLLAQFGYDLRPLRDKMGNVDHEILQGTLLTLATKRLISRVNHRRPLMRYLPRNHFASVRIIRSPIAMTIFAQLFLENPALADDVHLYEENDQDILLNDLTPKREPHLLIAFGNVNNFLSAAEKKGLAYGKRIVSFRREYLARCEKIFRNLGK